MGKKISRTSQTSKGERRSVNRNITKAVRRDRTELDKIVNAWTVWKKGKTTPKIIQKSLGVKAGTLYKSYFKYVPMKGKSTDD
jgi:hypothetical protein|tara:strand:- start:813 stop:1061 length:249 start_codon:yes stop_codon:yes gene_type:complete